MHEISVLKKFLDFPINSVGEIFDEFKTIEGHIFREKNTRSKKRFLYVEGKRENKVLLVAHADTYFDKGYFSEKHAVVEDNGILKAIDENGKPQLLGADDRAGVAMLWLLKDSGHSLLITDSEEDGRIASKWLMKENRDIAEKINQRHQFIIQLDRCNGREFKCYKVGTPAFRAFITEQSGYTEPDFGAKTDICSLCNDICGVNFSIGYYDQHSDYESLNINEWLNTLNLVKKILAIENLPKFHLPALFTFCFAHESFNVTVRLNTNLSLVVSRSKQKYPKRSN